MAQKTSAFRCHQKISQKAHRTICTRCEMSSTKSKQQVNGPNSACGLKEAAGEELWELTKTELRLEDVRVDEGEGLPSAKPMGLAEPASPK